MKRTNTHKAIVKQGEMDGGMIICREKVTLKPRSPQREYKKTQKNNFKKNKHTRKAMFGSTERIEEGRGGRSPR